MRKNSLSVPNVRNAHKPFQSGYTLLEVLIVIALFSIVGMLTFSGFRQITTQQQNLEDRSRSFQKEQQIWQLLAQDFGQVVPRWVEEEGHMLAPLYSQNKAGVAAIELSRLTNPYDKKPLQPIRVSYVFQDEQFWRYETPVDEMDSQRNRKNSENNKKQTRYLLLDDVVSVSFRFKHGNGNWYQSWPTDQNQFQLPVVFEVIFQISDGQLLKKRFHGYQQRKVVSNNQAAQ